MVLVKHKLINRHEIIYTQQFCTLIREQGDHEIIIKTKKLYMCSKNEISCHSDHFSSDVACQ